MPINWWPIHIPNTGNPETRIEFKRTLHLLAVVDGSPGPLDKKIPSGSNLLIISILVNFVDLVNHTICGVTKSLLIKASYRV